MPEVADLWVSLRAITAPFTDGLAKSGVEAERFSLQLKAIETSATAAGKRLTALGAEAERAASGMKVAGAESAASGTRMNALGVEAERAGAGLRVSAAEARSAGTAMEGSAAKADLMGGKLATVGALGALAVAGIGIEAVKMGSSFQAEMTKINTQAMVSKDQIAPLSNAVLNLAGQVGFAPDSLAEALFHVESSFASTGITAQKALEILKVGAEGAAVGHSDLVETVNAMDAAIASGIPGVDNFNESMGALNAIVGSGDMSMQDLTKAFGAGGGLAVVKGYGLTIQDVGAGLATFGDNNLRGAASMTNLRMAVQALAVPAKSAGELLTRFNMTTHTLSDDMQKGGLKLALDDLNERFKKAGVTATEQGQIITEMFGKKAGAGIALLMGQYDRTISKYPELAKGATTFGDAWTTTSQTLSQQLKDIRYGFDALMIRVGEFLIPYVSKAITAVESFGKGAVKGLTELWTVYGQSVKDKLSEAAGFVQSGAQKMLVPLKAELTSVAITAIPLAITAVERFQQKLRDAADAAKPVVSGLHDLYTSATSSGGALDILSGRIKVGAGLLVGLVGGLSQSTSLLRPLGELVGGVAHAFSLLPGPIQLSVLGMIAMRPFRGQIQGLQDTVVGYGRSAVDSFNGVRGAIQTQAILAEQAGVSVGRWGASFAALEAHVPVVGAMATSFRNTSAAIEEGGGKLAGFRGAVGGVATAVGTGARMGLMGAMSGLYSFMGGPWGIAIGGVMMGLDLLAKRQQEAAAAAEAHRQRISTLAQALQQSKGQLDASLRATAVQTLADTKLADGKTQLLDVMHKAGIGTLQLTDAYLGQGGSIDGLRKKLQAAVDQNYQWTASGKSSQRQLSATGETYKAALDALGGLNNEVPSAIARQKDLADAVNGSSGAVQAANDPAGRLKKTIDTLASAESSAEEKANALRQALKLLSGGTLDVQAAVAGQNQAVIDLNAAWKDNLDASKGYGASLLQTSGAINTASENGQRLFNLMQSLSEKTAGAAQSTYDFAKANGATVPDALRQAEGAMQKSWDAAVTTAQKLGLTGDQARNLAAQMGLIPSNLAITLAVKDMNPTQQAMLYVQGLADHLQEGATVKIGALPDAAIHALNDIGVRTQTLPDGFVQITVPDRAVMAKLAAIESWQFSDKYVGVHLYTVNGDQYAHGYADGGIVQRFADGGVLRAADGMTVPGYAPRRDIVPALLSPGEGVLVPEAVRAIGGAPAITAINRQARSGTSGLAAGRATDRLAVNAPSGGGQTVVVNVTVQGSVLSERDLRDVVQEQFLRLGMRSSTSYQPYARR